MALGWEGRDCPQAARDTSVHPQMWAGLWRARWLSADGRCKTPKQAAQRDRDDAAKAAARLTLGGAIGLAIRDHRRRLGMSQRTYAAARHWTPNFIARLETRAGRFLVDDVVGALDGTGFTLGLIQLGETEDGVGSTSVVDSASWTMTDLIARVRDGSRRFPAHHEARPDTTPPWWWHREFFVGKGPEPYWYAPRSTSATEQLTGPDDNQDDDVA